MTASKINSNKKFKQGTTEIEYITQEYLQSYLIKVTKAGSTAFYVPVIDVRDGEDQRKAVKELLKSANQSKFIKPKYNFLGQKY